MEKIIKKLNSLFRKEELRMKDSYLKLKENAEEMLRKNEISDYENDLKLELFTRNKSINKKYGVEEGDPFYETICVSVDMFEDDEFFNMNWSEGDHDFPICYSMHDVLYHSRLDLDDLEAIDFVYYDLKFIYQFCIEEVEKNN